MIDFTIKVENEKIAEAFKAFIMNYRTNISDFMNQLVNNDGSPCDSDIVDEKGTIVVYHIAPDKGFVLGEVAEGKTPFQVMQYTDLADEKRYILPEKDRLSLLLKQPTGAVDIRLGAFKSLSDAATAWNSEPVKAKLAEAEQYKKAKEKDVKRLQKLGKLPIEEAQVVSNTNE
jgi:hypothetical protein